MTYKGSYAFHLPKDMKENVMWDKITRGVKRKIEMLKRKGLIGIKNPIAIDEIVKWIEEIGLDSKEKFIQRADRIDRPDHRDYSWYLYDVAYKRVWNDRIRKPDNIALDETEKNCNTCRFSKKSKGILFCRKHKKNTIENEICDVFRNKLLNEYYMPEILYLDGTGWIIAENSKNLNDYVEQRESKLQGQKTILSKRYKDTTRFLQLKEHPSQELLSDVDKEKDVA